MALAGLVGVIVLAIAVVYAVTSSRMSKVYTFNDRPLTVPTDSASIASGQHFVEAIAKCANCHGDGLVGGGVPIAKNLLSANLTPTGIGKWSEANFRKALRDGIRPDGRMLSAAMPWPYTRLMTDEEIHALWLYIHSVPPRNARGH